MKIAILGYGVEGKSVERYFGARGAEVAVFDEGSGDDFGAIDFSGYDLVFRSPSVRPDRIKGGAVTSATRYFFEKCPAKIIGVTGTKGKGTISSMICSILAAAQYTQISASADALLARRMQNTPRSATPASLNSTHPEQPIRSFGPSDSERSVRQRVWLVGNIGVAVLDVLDKIGAEDVVVYEMSSFQLWDLERSPQVAVVGRIEEDHLNVHEDMADYVGAKRNIVRYQGAGDVTVYFAGNEASRKIGESSAAGEKLAYPSAVGAHVRDEWFWFGEVKICEVSVLRLLGAHNVENALAAISACFRMVGREDIRAGLADFEGLPHRLELVREVDGVRYYDDNYSSATPATEVAVAAFDVPVILIAGGYDKGVDYGNFIKFLNGRENLKKVILMGQVAGRMSEGLTRDFEIVDGLASAVRRAREVAVAGDVVVMSPGAASFDAFKNFTERAEVFQRMVGEL